MSESLGVSRPPELRYVPLERLEISHPVDRIEFIAHICAGHRVLDLGAMDETAWTSKRGRGTWLHDAIAAQARFVDGVDNSAVVSVEGLPTAANAVIRRGDVNRVESLFDGNTELAEVIVAGELIEHLENPLHFLRQFAAVERLSGKTLILSTPNASALHNFLIGAMRRESTHEDHLCILSYKTLSTLCRRAGFKEWEIIPYFSRFDEMKQRHVGVKRLAVGLVQGIINSLEWIFPLLSFGYIVRIRL
jgi:hypothetical protein